MSFSRMQEARYELRQQEQAALIHERALAVRDEGRGLENVPTCPHCGRATVLMEIDYTPQLTFGFVREIEPAREASYLACEWCGTEITREELGDLAERAPRKPAASSGFQQFDEWVQRGA